MNNTIPDCCMAAHASAQINHISPWRCVCACHQKPISPNRPQNYRVSALLTRRYEMIVSAYSEAEAWAKAQSFDYLWDTDLDVTNLSIESVTPHEIRKELRDL